MALILSCLSSRPPRRSHDRLAVSSLQSWFISCPICLDQFADEAFSEYRLLGPLSDSSSIRQIPVDSCLSSCHFSLSHDRCVHDRFLWFPPEQRPIVCQLGGSDPGKLAAAARIVARYGYDEINLNCGCPSDRVAGAGCFGASLMLQPANVAACCAAMREAVESTAVTVKCRLGACLCLLLP
jgi:hypothetical protein